MDLLIGLIATGVPQLMLAFVLLALLLPVAGAVFDELKEVFCKR